MQQELLIVIYLALAFFITMTVLYMCLEYNYFIRSFFAWVISRFFKKKINVLDEATVKGICITTDIDTLLYHMNNARFMRELDFARIDFYERTGLYKCIKRKNGTLAVGASTVRYRRFIRLFNRYVITSKIIYWDDQSIYMEHRFITPKENFVNAIVITKTRLINCSAEEVMTDLITNEGKDIEATKSKPEMPIELEKWIEFNNLSSEKLRGVTT